MNGWAWDERRVRRGLLGLIPLALAMQFVASARTSVAPAARAESPLTLQGRTLYELNCMSCHGVGAAGTDDGPALLGVGAASVDFQLSTGRMPLADPAGPVERKEPRFAPEQIDAIVAYVTSLAPGGQPIPLVDTGRGDLAAGQLSFADNCAACHGVGGSGDSIGGNQIAPSLYEATDLQVAEAIRVGPGAMPRFDEELVPQQELDDLARYVGYLRDSDDPGGLGLGRVGPVAEGLVGLLIGLGVLILVIRFTGSRT